MSAPRLEARHGPGRAALAWCLAVLPVVVAARSQLFGDHTTLALLLTGTPLVVALLQRSRRSFDASIVVAAFAAVLLARGAAPLAWWTWAPALLVAAALGVWSRRGRPWAPSPLATSAALASVAISGTVLLASSNGLLAARNWGVIAVGLPLAMSIGLGATPRRTVLDPIGWPALVPASLASAVLLTRTSVAASWVLTVVALAVAAGTVVLGRADDGSATRVRGAGRRLDARLAVFDVLAERVIAVLAAAAHRLLHLVVATATALVWLVVVLLPWAINSIVRWQPLRPPSAPNSRWVAIERRTASDHHRTWTGEQAQRAARRRATTRALPRNALLAIVVLGLVALAVEAPEQLRSDPPREDAGPSSGDLVVPDDPLATQKELSAQLTVSTYAGTRLPDFESDEINIDDEQRQVWRGDHDDCSARVVVWAFGGSALFGLGQRDDETILSEVAKQAADDGIDLEVHNFAVPGDVAFQEHHRLQQRLATAEEPPHLVIAYDGYNDVLANMMAYTDSPQTGFRALLDSEVLWAIPEMEDEASASGEHRLTLDAPQPTSPRLGWRAAVAPAIEQYVAASRWMRATTDAADLPFAHYLQPSLATRRAEQEGEPPPQDGEATALDALLDAAPDDVVDLTGVLDQVDEPVYTDTVHTSPLGAQVAAEAIYADLSARFDLAAMAEEPTSCR